MKVYTKTLVTIGSLAFAGFALAEHHGENGGDKGHDHSKHGGHGSLAGPNQGRMLHKFQPHAEFFVREDRKVVIRFYTHGGEQKDITKASINVICGERSKPTRLAFEVKDNTQVSTTVLPEGENFPVLIQIKTSEEAAKVTERFQLNLADCPSCENKEYACSCDHDH